MPLPLSSFLSFPQHNVLEVKNLTGGWVGVCGGRVGKWVVGCGEDYRVKTILQ